eukprot:TRINITY_DN31848_c0_g1_i1.p1 TRINITY_DN31848_c0_g1~~TRINITY_DN31848_c0_g1_i1.p1  ORF type:complete len:233 (+),score=2.55 TRINITY_DN31848_c0_g1_i1:131-829(+)
MCARFDSKQTNSERTSESFHGLQQDTPWSRETRRRIVSLRSELDRQREERAELLRRDNDGSTKVPLRQMTLWLVSSGHGIGSAGGSTMSPKARNIPNAWCSASHCVPTGCSGCEPSPVRMRREGVFGTCFRCAQALNEERTSTNGMPSSAVTFALDLSSSVVRIVVLVFAGRTVAPAVAADDVNRHLIWAVTTDAFDRVECEHYRRSVRSSERAVSFMHSKVFQRSASTECS